MNRKPILPIPCNRGSYDVKFGDGTTMKKFLFIGTDQNHNRMGPFINGIKQAVLNFDPSYPSDRAETLAMGNYC